MSTKSKTDNAGLMNAYTDSLAAASEALTAAQNAAHAAADARADLANGYVPEGTGLIQAGSVTINDAAEVKALQEKAAGVSNILKGFAPKAERKQSQGQRPQSFQLIWAATGLPVEIGDGSLGTYANMVKKLRGPAYKEAIGDKLNEVCLVNTSTGEAAVAAGELTFADAPGRPAKS